MSSDSTQGQTPQSLTAADIESVKPFAPIMFEAAIDDFVVTVEWSARDGLWHWSAFDHVVGAEYGMEETIGMAVARAVEAVNGIRHFHG